MERLGCDQMVYTPTILIYGLFRKHKNEVTLKLWDVMIDKGIAPTPASFSALSTGLCLSGKFTRACKIFDDLAPMGVVPETAHKDMISVLCKARRIEHAWKLTDGIPDKGQEIPGRVRTMMFNALRQEMRTWRSYRLYDRVGIKRRVKVQTLLNTWSLKHQGTACYS